METKTKTKSVSNKNDVNFFYYMERNEKIQALKLNSDLHSMLQ